MKDKKTRRLQDRALGFKQTIDTEEANQIPGQAPLSSLSRKFPRPADDGIIVCPVGGVGRIGMNMTLYGFAGKWIMVDAGSAFAKDVEGVGGIMPDPKSLAAILPHLEALLVTHAHEDHIGAIHHLWPTIKCPIYATPFAIELLRGRLAQKGTQNEVKFKAFKPGDTLSVGPFTVQTVPITHSTPECVSMAISTKIGTIMHTGDWKLDPDPLIGTLTDIDALKAIGDRGVLALLCDSTNAEREAGITSESDVARNMEHVFRTRRGAIVISCFATNVARLAAIGQAASATGRKVALAGRSLETTEAAARAVGLIDDTFPFLADVKHLKGLEPHEMVIVCTGTQGEERAALAKLARRENWRLPEIGSGDTVIHSARAIPGNEEPIEAMMALFRKRGIEVLMGAADDKALHVTGHASRGELQTMYGLIRPKFAIPVHGEPSHMTAHAKLAMECGVAASTLSEEGDVLRVTRTGVQKIAQVKITHLAVLESLGENLVAWDLARNAPVQKKQAKPAAAKRANRARRQNPKPPIFAKPQQPNNARAA